MNLPAVHVLSNGLRAVVCQTVSNVSYIGVAIGSGSRDESERHHGLAHFVEHTIFKGTRHRKSAQVSARMESIGGELNAYTSKEETVIYTNAPAGRPERAIELLADLIGYADFPNREIDMEREVVLDEINSYLDSPADSVFDEFDERIFSGSALAHNILGTPDSVKGLTAGECRGFLDRHYVPSNMVVYVADPTPEKKILRLLEKHFSKLHYSLESEPRITPGINNPFSEEIDRNGHQAHTIVGRRIFGRRDPRRHALFLLNNYLGGPSMNSRLNTLLREKRGLVYTVDSSLSLLSDCGLHQVYFGADRHDVGKCLGIIRREIEALAEREVPPRKFNAMKEQYCGQLLVATDHRENMAISMAKGVMYYGEVKSTRETAERIREVTPAQMREVAEMLASAPEGRLTIC